MKYITLFFLSILFFSCSDKNKVTYSLPSNKDINEIVETIIHQDSIPVYINNSNPDTIIIGSNNHTIVTFPINHKFSLDLEKLCVFSPVKKNDSIELTPPLPIRGLYLQDLITRGEIDKTKLFTNVDSAYLFFQNDTLKHFTFTSAFTKKINTTTRVMQENIKDAYFASTIPIFSSDKSKAYVELTYHCYGLCGSANSYILKKVNGKWILIKKRGLWVA